MEHLVRFTTEEGREGQHVADSLDDALRFVERLRNAEATTHVRLYRMQEVPITFRAYFKVELAGDGETPTPSADAERERPAAAAPAHGTADTAGDPGSRRLFSRT